MAPAELDLDSMAIVGHIAEIVHAFKEAVNYVKRIKERRQGRDHSRNALLLDSKLIKDLEYSLQRGQDVVRSHYERDYRRFGQPYARGDEEASTQLKNILSQLQMTVLANLKSCYQHDQDIDLLLLQDISDESQDKAVMTLIMLHQRVLISGNLEGVARGQPYPGSKRGSSRARNPPRPNSEKSEVLPVSRHGTNYGMVPEELQLPMQRARDPPTPELSPSQDLISPRTQVPANNPFRRAKSPMLPQITGQPAVPTLPTPPAEKMSASPSGPPPTAPLPPAPIDRSQQKRREELIMLKHQAERLAQGDRVQREQSERTWDYPLDIESDTANKYRFEEPHPGVEVDPSRVDESLPEFAPLHPRSASSVQARSSSRPRPTSRATPAAATYSLIPPRFHSRDRTSNASTDHDDGNRHPERYSMTSNATSSSYTSGSSGTSAYSRATTSSSNASFPEPPPVPSMPVMNLATRGKSIARVPEPIYEGSSAAESRNIVSPTDLRRPSAPDSTLSSEATTLLHSQPPVPAVPADKAHALDARRGSSYSQQSSSSTGTSLTAMPPPSPVRTVATLITDASNSKAYLPTEGNKFSGLCKGAWRAQVGDFKKAYQTQQRPGGVASNRMVDFVKCKNCDFQGKVATDAKGKKGPDRSIINAKDTGLAYRWDFLFKSHLATKLGSSADAEFGCMFCCAEGKGTPVFKGMSAFIAHTAEHRPGAAGNNNSCQVPDVSVCDRMEALVGRAMNAEEHYEVGLPVTEIQTLFGSPNGLLSPISPQRPRIPVEATISKTSSRY